VLNNLTKLSSLVAKLHTHSAATDYRANTRFEGMGYGMFECTCSAVCEENEQESAESLLQFYPHCLKWDCSKLHSLLADSNNRVLSQNTDYQITDLHQ